MLFVVEENGGADVCLERSKTLRGPSVDQLQGGVQGNTDGKLQTREDNFELLDTKTLTLSQCLLLEV